MRLRFYTADVFTDRPFGGNPLAVFPDARGLDPRRMQRIARELNLSETAFVLPPEDPAHTRRLRIFTPDMELPFAGHPTVGTALVLAMTEEVALTGEETAMVFEEGVGPVWVAVRAEGGRPVFAQLAVAQMPERGPTPPPAEALAVMLSLAPEDLAEGRPPQAWSAGVPFLLIPLRDRDALRRARLDLSAWERTLADFWAPHVYPFTIDGDAVFARMFSPPMGIAEDPATGAAATALAGLLALGSPDGLLRWTVTQGVEMGRPSLLHVEAEKRDGRLDGVRVGGGAVLVSEGVMTVPDDVS